MNGQIIAYTPHEGVEFKVWPSDRCAEPNVPAEDGRHYAQINGVTLHSFVTETGQRWDAWNGWTGNIAYRRRTLEFR